MDHKSERDKDVKAIRDSPHPRKVVVAGPGTGKSYLFSEVLKKKRAEGKTKFLAITFIGKLGDALSHDLCGLAETTTMHGFARKFVLGYCGKGWTYYPKMHEIIQEDLKADGIKCEIADKNYAKKTKHYKSVGDADVIHYAVKICKKDPDKIPVYDLVLIDEYQDFNEIESEFVDLLAKKNEIIIVGDDDQALYVFKGSSPSFIRNKYDSTNTDFERHTLRFCSRCTEVIIEYFHALVARYNLNDPAKGRIQKEYVCYVPDKVADSKANPKIHLITNCPPGMIASKIKYELKDLVENQKIKDVLVVGEARTCKALLGTIAMQLANSGFRFVDHRHDESLLHINQNIVDAYKFIQNDNPLLGWRILGEPNDEAECARHIKNAETLTKIISGTPSQLKAISNNAISDLEAEIQEWESQDGEADADTIRKKQNSEVRKNNLFKELKLNNLHLPRPLCNIEITVCNILNSKGLGADVIFVVGFDQGKFPAKKEAVDSEVYQMLVALTRAKKRIYLINTIGKNVSSFIDCLNPKKLEVDKIKMK